MSKYFQILILAVFFLGYLNSFQTFSQTKQTTIEVIKNSPTNFEGDEVEFSGLVEQYVKDKGSTNYYLIKGDYGGIIRVNTSEPAPETNLKYRVKGIVYIDAKTNTVFVSEKSKVLVPAGSEVTTKSKTTGTVLPPPPKDNTLLYALLAALAVLIGAFTYFQMKKRNSENEYSPSSTYQDQNPQFQQPKGFSSHENVEDKPMYTSENEYKTIKIVRTSPKTLKFIPGKLIITDGPDKGKEFRVAGFPTPEGFIVSIGRKEVDGDMAYAHIKLNEKTVSRDQAELHYIDHKLYLKNLSETNFTQLNGSEIKPGKIAEVSSGSTIRTGEVEFKYVV